MRHGTIFSLSVAALALASCGQKATTSTDTTTTVSENNIVPATDANTMVAPVASPGQAFANTAAASDAFEISTSQLAATNAASSAVKSFAQKMIAAHTESTTKLKAAASSASPALTPDPTLTADQEKKLTDLKAMTGADFDKAYVSIQVDAHKATLDALKAYSTTGDVPQLKAFATSLVPIVTAHFNMADALKRRTS